MEERAMMNLHRKKMPRPLLVVMGTFLVAVELAAGFTGRWWGFALAFYFTVVIVALWRSA